jgi:hypothetical protein
VEDAIADATWDCRRSLSEWRRVALGDPEVRAVLLHLGKTDIPSLVPGSAIYGGGLFEKLPETATDEAKKLAVVFDFDTDSCYPSLAVSAKGEMNGGLKPTGDVVGECREKEQLENSNTYYRKASITKDGVEYSVHMYALYFKKDQWASVSPIGAGHRHEWEFALVWAKNGEITHASTSAHGKVSTEEKAKLNFDDGKGNSVKVVYHKDGVGTHCFRFAKEDEKGDDKAENELKHWITPTLVDWDTMKSDAVSNDELRKKFNEHNFGDANCSFNDNNFPNEIAKNPPKGYPTADEWKAAAKAK